MTPSTSRRFRFGVFALCWLLAAALQAYAGDVGIHGAVVGAYVPGWLLAIAAVPPWTLLLPAIVDAAIVLPGRVSVTLARALTLVNAVGLIAYAFVCIAVIFYVAFANNGIA